jgi:hypothetical protein
MHKRKEIIANQSKFYYEIVKSLKEEFKQTKRELKKIKSKDPEIMSGKKSLLLKSEKININKDVDKFFISWKNTTPVWYAWWDENREEVVKLKYIDTL